MDTAITIFQREDFGEIRTALVENEPYFCLADVCKPLGLGSPGKVTERLKEFKGVTTIHTLTNGGLQPMTFISEANLYRVIFQSRKPEARKFEAWVVEEVLPAIRRTGHYGTDPKALTDPEELLLYSLQVVREKKALELKARQLEEQRLLDAPKVDFFDSVTESPDTIPMGSVAKVLNMGIGPNNLFRFLMEQRVLMSDNIPYQEYQDRGYFKVAEVKWTKPDGEPHIYLKTVVYQSGVNYIRRLLEKNGFGKSGKIPA